MGALAQDTTTLRRTSRAQKRPAIDVILEQVDDEDRDAILTQMDDPTVPAREVARWLQGHGFLVYHDAPEQAVQRFRERRRRATPAAGG